MMDNTQYGEGLEARIEPELVKKDLGRLEHPEFTKYYFIKKLDSDFLTELLKFETNTLRKLCHLSDYTSKAHEIMRAQDGTAWLNSIPPLLYAMEEVNMREGYVAYFKKKASIH
jgi:hypothetical protein